MRTCTLCEVPLAAASKSSGFSCSFRNLSSEPCGGQRTDGAQLTMFGRALQVPVEGSTYLVDENIKGRTGIALHQVGGVVFLGENSWGVRTSSANAGSLLLFRRVSKVWECTNLPGVLVLSEVAGEGLETPGAVHGMADRRKGGNRLAARRRRAEVRTTTTQRAGGGLLQGRDLPCTCPGS